MKFAALALASALLVPAATAAIAAPAYVIAKEVALGAPDKWDYVTFDGEANRVFIAHADRLTVVNPDTGMVVGNVEGIPGGTHGTAISHATGQGFTDDGEAGTAVAFDIHSLKVLRAIPAKADADGIASDLASGHLFVVDGDSQALSVIDPKTDASIATIDAGEKLEFAASDNHGSVFVAGEANGDMLKIDARSNRIAARWPMNGCSKPHGVAVDARNNRVFMGCVNNLMLVVDGVTGKEVARLPIGKGSDAVAFDPVRRRIFSSNGVDGTITGYQQLSKDRYQPLPIIRTLVSARTMSVDPKSGRLFVAGAETDPSTVAGARPKVRPGSLKLLILEPRG